MRTFFTFSMISLILFLTVSCNRKRATLPDGKLFYYKYCDACDGYGSNILGAFCNNCKGKGYVYDSEASINATIEDIKRLKSKEDNVSEQRINTTNITNNDGIYYPNDGDYSIDNTNHDEVVSMPEPVMCRGCHGTGDCYCTMEGHSGQMLSHYNSSSEPIYVRCNNCHGTGRCSGCGGDGYLDYGVDY